MKIFLANREKYHDLSIIYLFIYYLYLHIFRTQIIIIVQYIIVIFDFFLF